MCADWKGPSPVEKGLMTDTHDARLAITSFMLLTNH